MRFTKPQSQVSASYFNEKEYKIYLVLIYIKPPDTVALFCGGKLMLNAVNGDLIYRNQTRKICCLNSLICIDPFLIKDVDSEQLGLSLHADDR